MPYFTADVEESENKVKERDGYVATVNLELEVLQRYQRLTFARVQQDCWVALQPQMPLLPPPNLTPHHQHSTIR